MLYGRESARVLVAAQDCSICFTVLGIAPGENAASLNLNGPIERINNRRVVDEELRDGLCTFWKKMGRNVILNSAVMTFCSSFIDLVQFLYIQRLHLIAEFREVRPSHSNIES